MNIITVFDSMLEPSHRRQIGALFPESELTSHPHAKADAYTQLKPFLHVIALENSKVVGHQAICHLAARPVILGLSDLVVAPSHQKLALDKSLIDKALSSCFPAAWLTSTQNPTLLGYLKEHGFTPQQAKGFKVVHTNATNKSWVALWLQEPPTSNVVIVSDC